VVAWLVENNQPRRLADLVHFAARHAGDADRQALYKQLAERRSWRKADVVLALGRAAQERGEKPAKEVQTAARRLAARLLDQPAEAQVRDGLEVARQFRLAELHDKICRHAAAGAPHAALRSAALDACAAADAQAAIP